MATSPPRALPAEHAFVIRFRAGVDPQQERIDGLIEHVVSGRAVRFGSWGDVRAFVYRLLTEDGR